MRRLRKGRRQSWQSFVMNRASYGYTIRFIQEYVLERKLFSIEEAIRKMTSLPADSAKLDNRGKLQEGMAADIVVLDLEAAEDRTTDDVPNLYPSGVELVVVNGTIVLKDETHTQALAGQRLPN